MPPRLHICLQWHHFPKDRQTSYKYISTASAITPAAPPSQTTSSPPPIARYHITQPLSHKPPVYRRSQLHRQYTSLLRSTPLLLLFQINNLKAAEWMSVRRELQFSLEKVDKDLSTSLAPAIKIQAVQTGIFESALLVADYYHPKEHRAAFQPHPTDPSTQSSAQLANHKPDPSDPTLTHYLSRTAHSAASSHKKTHPLRNLLCCPLAAVSFPSVSPEHMRAALSILAPKAPTFAAPTRRVNPGYYDPNVQQAVQKLMFLGARVEGRVFDNEGARSVGAIEGGMEGLRGQLVRILGEMGAGVTQALEGMGRSLWVTLEYRRENMQEEEEKEKPGE